MTEKRDAYVKEKLAPILEPMVAACMRGQPADCGAFMSAWLQAKKNGESEPAVDSKVEGQTREEYVAASLTPMLEPLVAEVLRDLPEDAIARMIEHIAAKASAPAPAADAAAEPVEEKEEDAIVRSATRKSIAAAAAALVAKEPPKEMPPSALKLLLARPKVPAPLDPNFAPLILGKRKYLDATGAFGAGIEQLHWALPRADGCGRASLPAFPDGHEDAEASVYLAGVLIQEMLWQRSGSELLLAGPPAICEAVAADFRVGGRYEFEIKSMPNVCGTPDKPFNVSIVSVAELPDAKDTPQVCGKDANGCRLAFDLGKSDIKVVSVKDNEVVYSKETEWDVTNPDPQYHFDAIVAAMKLGKEALPQIDAIGGSATGTVSGANEATWCDIFPNVPADVYKEKVVDIFVRIAKELAGDVPLKVINDGEVTALAAVQKIGKGNVMGISMGSSEGGGYANGDGNLLGWINELCYMKLDMNPDAPTDPWSKGAHTGLSHMYLGQRGATKLAAAAGVDCPPEQTYPHPDMCTIRHENHAQCLKAIQKAMADPAKEPQTRLLYETVGVYLGYGLAQYCEFYKIDHVMILGRVSKGAGGDLMLSVAKKVLETEFPEYASIEFHTADDHFKAVGQCIAAAALPEIK